MEGTALVQVKILLFLTLGGKRVQIGELFLALPLGAQGTPKKEELQVPEGSRTSGETLPTESTQ